MKYIESNMKQVLAKNYIMTIMQGFFFYRNIWTCMDNNMENTNSTNELI